MTQRGFKRVHMIMLSFLQTNCKHDLQHSWTHHLRIHLKLTLQPISHHLLSYNQTTGNCSIISLSFTLTPNGELK